jgi:signal transduction histidine kinase
MARLLRHEVGDLLQSVYSTVAVLMERLPAEMKLERRLVTDLKNRAELCRGELDAVVDLVSQPDQTSERIDLGAAVTAILNSVQRRFPALPIQTTIRPGVSVLAEPRTLNTALGLLLVAMCQAAQKRVEIGIDVANNHAECRVERDGYAATPEQLAWLGQPFATTQHALFGLGLALVQRAVRAGGEVLASNREDGGVSVRIRFPVCASV